MDTNKEAVFVIPKNWETQSKELRTTYEHLTDADLKHEPGRENELIASIGSRLHLKREEVLAIIEKGRA
jgi:hypothetical protein